MNNMKFEEQQYLQSLERSLRLIRSGERLSLEASIEELCKVLLIQIYLERKSQRTLDKFVGHVVVMDDDDLDYYHELFKEFGLDYSFKGWDYLKLKLSTLMNVVDELTNKSLFESEPEARAKAFTDFLQLHYSGYLSEYSTPSILNKYIMDVVDPQRFHTFADPCCGLGGFLVEATVRGCHSLEIKGYDINQRMVNTANLQLLMYGCDSCFVNCVDFTEVAIVYADEQYEVVASHLPSRYRTFSIAGKRSDLERRHFSNIPEDVLISQILKMLKIHGIAALVVSDDFLYSAHRYESRRWLYENVQILNITRFDGIAYNGSSNMRAYNVMFLRRLDAPTSDVCSATLFKAGTDEAKIKDAAQNLRKAIYAEDTDVPKDEHFRYFRLLEEDTWNVDLIFAREKMGWNYPICRLRNLMFHDRQRAKVGSGNNYKQLTVKSWGLGVVDRKEEYSGTHIERIRYAAKNGQIIISSQEAVKGAVGIVPKELNNALVSNNYYLFTVDSPDVDPDYLVMVLSSEPVLKQLSFYKRGIARPRVTIEDILSLVIPLPSIEEQKMLVANLKKKVKQAQMIQNDLEKEQKEFSRKLFGE